MLQEYTPPKSKNVRRNKGGRLIPITLLALFCCAAISSQNASLRSTGNVPAFLRSRWDRFLLYFADPKTKIYRKASDGFNVVVDVAVLVMGEAAAFEKWYDNMKDIDKDNVNLVLIYASYDDAIQKQEDFHQANIDGVKSGQFVDFEAIPIIDKTWTEGRNILAAQALRKEKSRGKEFDYWFFLDDDVEPVCHPATDRLFGEGSCWQKVFNFLGSEAVPQKASTVALPSYFKDGFSAVTNVNGFNVAIKRSHISYFIPYTALKPGMSQWISQAAHMCVTGSCMPNSVVFIPLIYAENGQHRDYPKAGYTIKNIHEIVTESFHDTSINFTPCHDWIKFSDYQEGEFSTDTSRMIGPYQTGVELNEHMSFTNTSYCTPLRNRFAEWEEEMLLEEDPVTHTHLKLDEPKGESEKKDIIVMVMGEAASFQEWLDRLRDITDVKITFIFASYNEEVVIEPSPKQSAENNIEAQSFTKKDLYFHTLYISKKTWTEGRNRLAEEALRMEKLRGKEFAYWLFLDDDVEPVCHPGTVKFLGGGTCWQKIFNFISGDDVPEGASTISLPWFAKEGFTSTSNTDALFAAFKRDTIPYVLPYATLPKGSSEWISQAANFCVINTCLTDSSVFVPYINVKNTKSRPYSREGFNVENIFSVVTQNYHNLEPGFEPCHNWNTIGYYAQGEHSDSIVGPFRTSDELNQRIPPHKYEYCSPLRNRFFAWEKSIMESLPDDSSSTLQDDSSLASTLPDEDASSLPEDHVSSLLEDEISPFKESDENVTIMALEE